MIALGGLVRGFIDTATRVARPGRAWRLAALAAIMGSTPTTAAWQGSTVAITNVTVIDVVEGAARPHTTVVVRGNRITAVGPADSTAVPNGARVVDARGLYLIPGLWDMHVHSAVAADRELPMYLALGVTGVRNMHSTVDTALELTLAIKRRLAAGTLLGPRFIANGPIVDGPNPIQRGSVLLRTPARARAVVDSLARGGADFIKVYERLPRDVYLAIADQAKRLRIPFAGHVPVALGVIEAADAGQRSVEHASALNADCSTRTDSIRSRMEKEPASLEDYIRLQAAMARAWSAERCAPVIAALRRNGTWVVPTLGLFRVTVNADLVLADTAAMAVVPLPRRQQWIASARERPAALREADSTLLEAGRSAVRALRQAGVPLLAGTDVGNEFLIPGYALHMELAALVDAGLTPTEALRAATIEPARFLQATDSLGAIRRGALADLVLLEANPLQDIRHARRVRGVFANGRYLDRVALDDLLRKASAGVPR